MKKILSLILSLCILCSAFSFQGLAAQNQQYNKSAPEFSSDVLNSQPEMARKDDGTYEVTFSSTQPTLSSDISPLSADTSEQQYTSTTLKFFGLDEEDVESLTESIAPRSGGGTWEDHDSILGSSCYISITTTYSTKEGARGTLYKVNSVKVSYSTNSGTTITSKVLYMMSAGTSEADQSVYKEDSVNVASNPYTSTLMNTWPYIYYAGLSLNASFAVTARRPSGESVQANVSTPLIVS